MKTFGEFRNEYLDYIQYTMTPKTQKNVKYFFGYLGLDDYIPLMDISARQVEHQLLKIYSNSPHLAMGVYRTMKAAFNQAAKWEYILVNPFTKFKLHKPPTKIPEYVNETQFALIQKQVKNPELKRLFKVLFYTGMRISEALAMTNDWIKGDCIYVKNSKQFTTKSKRERVIPIADPIINDVYPFNKLGMKQDRVSHLFKKYARQAGFENIHLHSLRHSFASNLVNGNIAINKVQVMLGHASVATTQVYSHLSIDSLKDAVKIFKKVEEEKEDNDNPKD